MPLAAADWPVAQSVEQIAANLVTVRQRITDACARVGREPCAADGLSLSFHGRYVIAGLYASGLCSFERNVNSSCVATVRVPTPYLIVTVGVAGQRVPCNRKLGGGSR